jgi:hypothetical protein
MIAVMPLECVIDVVGTRCGVIADARCTTSHSPNLSNAQSWRAECPQLLLMLLLDREPELFYTNTCPSGEDSNDPRQQEAAPPYR